MNPGFTARRKWIVGGLGALAVGGAIGWSIFSKPEGRVSAEFLGYALEPPKLSLDFRSSARLASARQGARVATFLLSNGCDFPVHCSLSAHYANGFTSFSPGDVTLEAHAATKIAGLANPPPSPGSPLSRDSTRTWTDWTNSWRLMVAYRKASSPEGMEEMRYRAALWFIKQKSHRLARVLNPIKIRATETDLIPPDVPVSGKLDQ